MIELIFEILGREWKMCFLEPSDFERAHGKADAGVTLPQERRIDIHKECNSFEIVCHELTHAYISEMCLGDSQLDWHNATEFFCEFMAKRGVEVTTIADLLLDNYDKVTKNDLTKTRKDGIVHYIDTEDGVYTDHSPCGDSDKDSVITNALEDVTCAKCRDVLKAKMN